MSMDAVPQGEMDRVLHSMGVEKYDPHVVTALNEYAKRLAGDLLCDARDYANHRGAGQDLDAADVQLAVKLSPVYTARAQPVDGAVKEVMDRVNRVPLSRLVNSDAFVIRYPSVSHPLLGETHTDVVSALQQRTYTLVPTTAAAPAPAPTTAINSSVSSHAPGDGDGAGMEVEGGGDITSASAEGNNSGASTLSAGGQGSLSLGVCDVAVVEATAAVVASEFQR